MALALTAMAPGTMQGQVPDLLADPDAPGPNLPPAGRSLFDELFEVPPPGAGTDASVTLPFPFERLLARLNAAIAPAAATTVLIPLGRSLQRLSADPDYFASPRIVLAVTEDAGDTGRALFEDRLFLGYHERARVIEVISYNETAGRFEFQVVEDYGAGSAPRVDYAERSVCVTCHQAHGPIFPTALWSETNADPRVADRLSELGTAFHGAPVRGKVDRADAFDRSTDRAARLAFANALWTDGCGAPDAARCRGELLLAALRYRLGGVRGVWSPQDGAADALAERIAGGLAKAAPTGLAVPSPDLPNRDPLADIEAGMPVRAAIEPEGVFDPSLPRAPLVLWRGPEPAASLLATAVGDAAARFADADVAWLDARLVALAGADVPVLARERWRCRAGEARRSRGQRELRLTCPEDDDPGRAALEGHVVLSGDAPVGGLVRSLALPGWAPVQRLVVAGGSGRRAGGSLSLELALREGALGLSARLASGERVAPLRIVVGADGTAEVELALLDDLAPLRAAIGRLVEAAVIGDGAALGTGPFRRRAILAELKAALGAEGG